MSNNRLSWIAACLRYRGQFGRDEKKSYAYHFGIGTSQVGRDQDEFISLVEQHLGPDVIIKEKGKLYPLDVDLLADADDLFFNVDLQDWLRVMLRGSYEKPDGIERADPPLDILRTVISAIQEMHPVEISYHSRNNPHGRRYMISPHTIVDIAGRYHVRGFDHSKGRWSDFVLNRMVWVRPVPERKRAYRRKTKDQDWNAFGSLVIEACENEQREAVRMDFRLDADFRRTINVREAFVRYLIDPEPGFTHPVTIRRTGEDT